MIRVTSLVIALSFAIAAAFGVGFPTPAGDHVTVTFGGPEGSIVLHGPVCLYFSAKNHASRATTVYLGKNRQANFRFTVVDPGGGVSQIVPPKEGGLGRIGKVTLPPDGTYNQTLVLSEWYPFQRPGLYFIRAELAESLPTRPDMPIAVWSSQRISIRVGPADSSQLASLCEGLLGVALAYPSNGDKGHTAAVALSTVRDPIALPYLARLLRASSTISHLAISGLVRIDTPEAGKILRSALGTRDPFLRAQIQPAIPELKTGVHPVIED